MTDETTLLPCPFCGGEAGTHETIDGWIVSCSSEQSELDGFTHNAQAYGDTEAEAIAAWNTRATHGTLTAEQVRECVQVVYFEGYSDGSVNRGQHLEETDWQAIAAELNARAERTCKVVASYDTADVDSRGSNAEWYFAFSCGCELYWDEPEPPNYCPNCGAKVRDE